MSDEAFERLLTYLRDSRAFDFTGYKRPSLRRRVRHQMNQVGAESFDDYLDHLQVHPDEFTALFNTILINVTSFFRDPDAWTYLGEQIVPALVEQSEDGPIRVWSAGCASGQEAYTLAMILAEALGPVQFRQRVKVYATDVDEDALAHARTAVYTDKEVQSVPEPLLERYFEHSAGRYAFRKDLRRNVVFGRNDMVQDAPISRIDLLACRNALMYFNADTQARILSRLGFALKPHGVLFLGKAEMLLNHTDQFEAIDLKRRVFRRRRQLDRPEVPEVAGVRLAPARRSTQYDQLDALRSEAFLADPIAQLVIDNADRLVLFNHRAGVLLALTERDIGRPFQDLEVSYRPAELRSHLDAARSTQTPVWLRDIEWQRSNSERLVLDIQLLPLSDARGHLLGTTIVINDVTRYRQLQDELESANRQLETAYEELQSTNEELETTNEELQSTVEELETTNEELQSTNEELETMNEELQSMNDELQSTNEELRERTSEITSLNQFMESILTSLHAAVVVLDAQLVVQMWNRQAEDLWGLREDETVGRQFLTLDSGIPAGELIGMIKSTIRDGVASGQHLLSAVNRRGRSIELRVSVSPLLGESGTTVGALLVMDATEIAQT